MIQYPINAAGEIQIVLALAGVGVSGKVAADLTVRVRKEGDANYTTLLPSGPTQYTLTEFAAVSGDYSLNPIASIFDTKGTLRVRIEGAGFDTEQYLFQVVDLADFKATITGLSTFDNTADEVDIGKVKGVAVTAIADFHAAIATLNDPTTAEIWDELLDTIKARDLMTEVLAALAGKRVGSGGDTIEYKKRDPRDSLSLALHRVPRLSQNS